MSFLQSPTAVIRRDVLSAKYAHRFAQGAGRHASLADHEDVASLLAKLEDLESTSIDKKSEIARALISEYQTTKSSFWSSLLICGYYPMLAHLRGRLQSNSYNADDLDQIVLAAFLEVVAEYPLERGWLRTAWRLRKLTEQYVFRGELHKERLEQKSRQRFAQLVLLIDDMDDTLMDYTLAKSILVDKDVDEIADLFVELAEGVVASDNLDLVIATVLKGEALYDYIARHGYHRHRQIYDRLRKRRQRTLEKLKKHFCKLGYTQRDKFYSLCSAAEGLKLETGARGYQCKRTSANAESHHGKCCQSKCTCSCSSFCAAVCDCMHSNPLSCRKFCSASQDVLD